MPAENGFQTITTQKRERLALKCWKGHEGHCCRRATHYRASKYGNPLRIKLRKTYFRQIGRAELKTSNAARKESNYNCSNLPNSLDLKSCANYDDNLFLKLHCHIQSLNKRQLKDAILQEINGINPHTVHIIEDNAESAQNGFTESDDLTRIKAHVLAKTRPYQECTNSSCIFPLVINSAGMNEPLLRTVTLPSFTKASSESDCDHLFWFNLTDILQYRFDSAKIYVLTKRSSSPRRLVICKAAETNLMCFNGHLQNQDDTAVSDSGWHHFSLTKRMWHWLIQNTPKVFGACVKARMSADSYFQLETVSSGNSMFLELSIESQLRQRRSISPLDKNLPEYCSLSAPSTTNYHINSTCCLYPLEVSFDEFGWDWIIAPKTLKISYCMGTCKIGQLKENIAQLQLISPTNLEDLCCSPDQLDPVTILFQDTLKNLHLRTVPNIVARKCSCS
ncbi:transforming growth factor beta like domain-containing protein [Ditylenchus destructor]|uniref:Transforming growth factor beta like domain-containing protein n=1 Tax=Ditylenchus destructor TaxID=166010 RepID=A0AAD4NGM8_9BILA|nr:transforming growth factor beta like domain-containing protein [Ditylenchus destructor]